MVRGNFVLIVIILRTWLVVCQQALVLLTTHALRRLYYRHRCQLHKRTVSYSNFVTYLRLCPVLVLDACPWTPFYGAVLECFL